MSNIKINFKFYIGYIKHYRYRCHRELNHSNLTIMDLALEMLNKMPTKFSNDKNLYIELFNYSKIIVNKFKIKYANENIFKYGTNEFTIKIKISFNKFNIIMDEFCGLKFTRSEVILFYPYLFNNLKNKFVLIINDFLYLKIKKIKWEEIETIITVLKENVFKINFINYIAKSCEFEIIDNKNHRRYQLSLVSIQD